MYENTTEYYAPEVTITGTELLELAKHKYISREELRTLLGLETTNGEED